MAPDCFSTMRRRERAKELSATTKLHSLLSQIHRLGKKAGAVLNPASPIGLIEHVLHLCDIVLVMTVNAGFGGQKFLPETLPKIRGYARIVSGYQAGARSSSR